MVYVATFIYNYRLLFLTQSMFSLNSQGAGSDIKKINNRDRYGTYLALAIRQSSSDILH